VDGFDVYQKEGTFALIPIDMEHDP